MRWPHSHVQRLRRFRAQARPSHGPAAVAKPAVAKLTSDEQLRQARGKDAKGAPVEAHPSLIRRLGDHHEPVESQSGDYAFQ